MSDRNARRRERYAARQRETQTPERLAYLAQVEREFAARIRLAAWVGLERLRSRQSGPRAAGQALVEFALVIPIVMMILLAGADIARWTAAQSGAQRAAGNIADAAARTAGDLSDLVTVELAHAGCSDGSAVIDGDTPSGVDTTYVTVTCPFAGFSPFFGGTVTARADAVVVAP